MSDPYETTEQHVERILRRTLNSFELSDRTVERLGTALAHSSSLYSSHHSATLHRETYRHTYLLSDGSPLTLWELVHGGPRGAGHPDTRRHELYDDEADAHIAAARLTGSPWDVPEFGDEETAQADLELLSALMAAPPAPHPRMYAPDNSADHARRVLRRAENGDGPGEETARLLRAAFAHHITQVFGRRLQVEGRNAGFTLYEHAFLLLDGSETSLWEVEHTATPDGRHMCEVYGDEESARCAMESRTRIC
ncbi:MULTISPECIES: DUF6227 family protein [unclassified Streptomyces]|uniref:DUF6227 family protein n=1 Tax=unclassified Streptomyces TaxID=2593676 RepID=UPI000DAD68BA|nr:MULTISPECIES: DUF6227 family protein [unclassified Streptomyces]PZT72360.1 hypothetical protein DNK55_27845 [Streptomyces sp. AC1-42T]PZT81320.1 hypothetical protein DNK56_03725 [Streptomyces sp. AC1-42W]